MYCNRYTPQVHLQLHNYLIMIYALIFPFYHSILFLSVFKSTQWPGMVGRIPAILMIVTGNQEDQEFKIGQVT